MEARVNSHQLPAPPPGTGCVASSSGSLLLPLGLTIWGPFSTWQSAEETLSHTVRQSYNSLRATVGGHTVRSLLCPYTQAFRIDSCSRAKGYNPIYMCWNEFFRNEFWIASRMIPAWEGRGGFLLQAVAWSCMTKARSSMTQDTIFMNLCHLIHLWVYRVVGLDVWSAGVWSKCYDGIYNPARLLASCQWPGNCGLHSSE